MNMPERLPKVLLVIVCIVIFSGCASVKPGERAYLNDREMQLDTRASAQFENYYESIREGSSIPGNGKSSEGCGCK